MSKKGDNPPQQPVQLPTDTYILSLNKKYAKVETNANNQLLYTLKNPIKLNTGDQVSLYKSYLNIRGLNSNTMTLDEDFDVDIKTGLFIPASLKRNASLGNDFYNYQNWEEYYQVPDPEGILIPYRDGEFRLNEAKAQNVLTDKYCFATQGDFNSPYIGVEVGMAGAPFGTTIYKPISVVANFKVSAGQYDVNALALEITNQLNGSQLTDAENQNIIYDGVSTSREFNKIFNRGGTFTKQFAVGTYGMAGAEEVKGAPFANYTAEKPIKGSNSLADIAFLDLEKADTIITEIKAYLAGDRSKSAEEILKVDRDRPAETDPQFTQTAVESADNLLFPKKISSENNGILGYTSTVNPTAKLKDVRYEIPDAAGEFKVNPIPFAGDADLVIGWFTNTYKRTGGGRPDADVELFGWNNLFQDYWYDVLSKHAFVPEQVPETELAKPQQFRNEEFRTYGTKSFNLVFNNENRFAFNNCSEPFRIASITGDVGGTQTPASAIGNQASKFNFNESSSYPQESSSGNFILSFDNKLLQQSQKYKDIVAEQAKHANTTAEYWLYEWALTMLPHDYFYDTVDEGANAWEDSLWNRLGFSYNELGNITPQLEKFNTPFKTDNTQSTMLGFMTHNSYGSALQIGMSGLGDSYTQDNKGSATIETFDEVGIMTQPDTPIEQVFELTTVSSYLEEYNKLISRPSYVFILATSQYFNATTLPDLSDGKNYFLVETDLVPSNYLDESNSQRAILGFVDKEFSSNDTIFSSTAIPFTMKQSKIVNTVMVNILNADGTKPIDTVLGNSSAFLIMVQRNSNAIFNYLEDEEIDLVAEEGTRPTTQTMTE
tara:strand:+ start:284 stop:2773 length:2490 start_codon:yes stop_codon:yes gene_type:complete